MAILGKKFLKWREMGICSADTTG